MTTRSARCQAIRQADETGDEVEARLYPGPERDQAAGEPPGGAGTGHAGDVDARLAPIARRHLGQASPERLDLGRGGALLRPEDRGGLEERCGDVAGHDELHPVQGVRRSHGVVGTLAPVGGRRAPAADHDTARPGLARRHQQLPDAGRAGAHRVVAPWSRQQGAPGGP